MKPIFRISNFHNDHQSAVTLMIDDLAPVAITNDGVLHPHNDHGYGGDKEGSLYNYLEQNLFSLFPEIKGTYFILTEQHYNHKPNTGGYNILGNGFDQGYIDFLQSMADRFDYAFHGTEHLRIVKNKVEQEFTYRTLDDLEYLKDSIEKFEEKSGIVFEGGKFPSYMSNEFSDEIIEKLGFKWWSFHNKMKGVKHPDNGHLYYGNENVMRFPTNFSGDAFKPFLNHKKKSLSLLRSAYRNYQNVRLENHLQYLYENQMIISIQEHFTTLRSDGKFQRPNVFDDIESLKRIYSILRGADVWHAKCNEIALYLENYDNSKIRSEENGFELVYSGNRDSCELSAWSKDIQVIIESTGKEHHGHRKNNGWVFNHLKPGKYSYKKD